MIRTLAGVMAMAANRMRAVYPVQVVPDGSQLFLLVGAIFDPFVSKWFRTTPQRSDQQICRFMKSIRSALVHLRKCRFEWFRTTQNQTAFALVKWFRTTQNHFGPGSRGLSPSPSPIGEGTGPSPGESVNEELRNRK